jgi:phthalate 4,5-dioxygenase oxygenase subunit
MYNLSILHIPQDDYNTYFYFVAWSDTGPGIDPEAWRKFCGAQPGVDLDSKYRKFRVRDNNYLQDRQAMKLGDFTGIRGIPMQDMAMWETMGRIADRSCERLGASDLAIVEFRRIMVDAVRSFAQGAPAIGTAAPRVPKAKLRSFEGIVPKSTDWKTLNVSPDEIAAQGHAHAAD